MYDTDAFIHAAIAEQEPEADRQMAALVKEFAKKYLCDERGNSTFGTHKDMFRLPFGYTALQDHDGQWGLRKMPVHRAIAATSKNDTEFISRVIGHISEREARKEKVPMHMMLSSNTRTPWEEVRTLERALRKFAGGQDISLPPETPDSELPPKDQALARKFDEQIEQENAEHGTRPATMRRSTNSA